MRGTSRRGLGFVCLVWTLGLCCSVSRGQEGHPAPLLNSELGRENLSRVAASAADIKMILVVNTGLMVELKRWVAKDATTHGQIVSDIDLTDDAIFDRLQSDVQFRSAATMLLQRYGYLIARVNPDSPAGREQELLAQERAKWMAQNEEEQLTKARQRNSRKTQNAGYCDQQSVAQCTGGQGQEEEQVPGQQRDQQRDKENPSNRTGPDEQSPQKAPRNNAGLVQRAGLA